MSDLFSDQESELSPFSRDHEAAPADDASQPLAERLRPSVIGDILGQQALLGPGAPLRRLIDAGRVPSMILWGPPGSGKTTLARAIANHVQSDFVTLSAVTSSVRDVRATVDIAKRNRKFRRETLLFIDEIHRFNKAQQDAFLPHVEAGIITLIGATTENPSFSVIAPLLSRCRVFTLRQLDEDCLDLLLRKGLEKLNGERDAGLPAILVGDDGFQAITKLSDGDARRALGMLEIAVSVKQTIQDGTEAEPITASDITALAQRHFVYDKTGEEHYNLISALHKTLRSSDPHGAMYWTGRMLASGEDPRYVARRIIRFACEDIGIADPRALTVALDALRTYEALGSPEGDLAIQQAAVYLALAPKSNAVYMGANAVAAEIAESGSLPVPLHLRNAPTKLMKDLDYGKDYTYDHDAEGGFAAKDGLPDAIAGRRFYKPTTAGEEAMHREKLDKLDKARDDARSAKRHTEK